ncbi:dicarboxylate/amino acid:cation symporter, partial [Elusimicrobiota bacterium]
AVAASASGNAVSVVGMPAAPLSGPAGIKNAGLGLAGAGHYGRIPALRSVLPNAGQLRPEVRGPAGLGVAVVAGPGTARLGAHPTVGFRTTPNISPVPGNAHRVASTKASPDKAGLSKLSGLARAKVLVTGHTRISGVDASMEAVLGGSSTLWEGGRKRAASLDPRPSHILGSFKAGRGNGLRRAGLDQQEDAPEAATVAGPVAEDAGRAKRGVFRQLWFWILLGLGVGTGTGLLLSSGIVTLPAALSTGVTSAIGLSAGWGDTFLTILRYLAGPLVFTSVINAIGSHENPKELRSLSWKVMLYFIFTSAVACCIGMGVAFLIQPGTFFTGAAAAVGEISLSQTAAPGFLGFLRSLIPTDPISPFIHARTLQVVFMSVVGGVLMQILKTRKNDRVRALGKRLVDLSEKGQKLVMALVKGLMYTAPLAVFGLMSRLFIDMGIGALAGMSAYVGTVVLGLVIMLGFYALLVKFVAKRNPLDFFKKIRTAMITGFSTASSAAAMPVSLRTSKEKLKVSPAVSDLLVTAGTAINMEGTALYQVVATIFLAQAFGIALSFPALLMIIGTLLLSSLGTPGAPGAGMAILATVLGGAGIPIEGIALILGVDRLLDMMRTSINVAGDLTSAVVMDRIAARHKKPDIPEDD